MSEEEYRTMLASYGVESSKELSYWRGVELIRKMESLIQQKVNRLEDGSTQESQKVNRLEDGSTQESQKVNRLEDGSTQESNTLSRKYEELGVRWDEVRGEYMATPKQLRMIEAMWMTHPLVDQKNEEALRKFVKKITGADKLEWLYMSDIRKVVNAIKSLKKKKGENLEP